MKADEAKLFSVIMPVYNVQEYLHKAIESVLNQSFTNFELIIVDDGSTDNSKNIIQKFLKNDKRITYFFQENMGLSEARNTGIRLSKGEFIFFMDSDDEISTETLSRVSETISYHQPSIIMFNYKIIEGNKLICVPRLKAGFYSSNYIFMGILRRKLENYAWQFVVHRSYFKENLFFKKGVYYEDIDWTPRLLSKADKIYYIQEPLYSYRMRSGSITHTLNEKKLRDLEIVLLSMNNTINNFFPTFTDCFEIWRKPLDLSIYFNYTKIGWHHTSERNLLRSKIFKYSFKGLSRIDIVKLLLIKFRILDTIFKIKKYIN